ARIEIDEETDPATMLRQMLDRQTQTTRTGWSKRKPVSAAREEFFGQRVAERFVVDTKVVNIDTRLRHARAAAGFKRVDRPIGVTFRHPTPHWTTTQPLVLKKSKTRQVVVGVNFFAWIPRQIFRVVQPEGTTGFRIEMPRDNFTDPGVEFFVIFNHGFYGMVFSVSLIRSAKRGS